MPQSTETPKRPFFLSLLCLFSWICFGLLAVTYLFGLLYKSWVTEVIGQYIPDTGWSGIRITIFFLTGFLLHLLAIAGTIFIWKLRRIGYPMLVASSILIAVSYLFGRDIAWGSIGFYLILPAVFALYYARMD